MRLKEDVIIKLIRESLIKNGVLEEDLKGIAKSFGSAFKSAGKDLASLFTTDKDIEAGQQLSWGGTSKSVTTLSSSVKERVSKEYYVLCFWDGDVEPETEITDAWDNKDKFGLFHKGGYDADHKKIITSKQWLEKAGYPNVTDRFIEKLKKKWDQGLVAVVSTKYLQSEREFEKSTDDDAFNQFVTDTSLEAVSALADLGAKWFPALEFVSSAAGLSNAMVKLGREDILGASLALITTIPVVGDTIGIMAKNFATASTSILNSFNVLVTLGKKLSNL